MPLLRRQPFAKQKPPPNLQPDEEVFHCKLTNEIFRDYEQFFERIILCNSLVWSCNLTGKSGLTYQEALESEEKARKQLATFPDYLQKPILYLTMLTHRSRSNELNDDIFLYCKDRFFLGEMVEVTVRGERRPGKVNNVIPPPSVASPRPSIPKNLENGSPEKPVTIVDSDDEVICLGVEAPESKPSTSKASPAEAKVCIDPNEYLYVIQEKGKLNTHTVGPGLLYRRKGLFTRDKLKLYLKLHCDSQGDGVWKVKDRFIKKFKLNEMSFNDFFHGPPPAFPRAEAKKIPKKKVALVNLPSDKELKKVKKALKKEITEEDINKMKITPEERAALKEKLKEEKKAEREKMKEELRGKLEEEKARRKEEREKLLQHLREEHKRLLAEEKRLKDELKVLILAENRRLKAKSEAKRKEARRREIVQEEQKRRHELAQRQKEENKIRQAEEKKIKEELAQRQKEENKIRLAEEKRIKEERKALQLEENRKLKARREAEKKEARKMRREEEKRRQEEEREKKKVEKRQMEEEYKEWRKPREDLDCDDLKPMPVLTPVNLVVSANLFGDIVMVLEFLHCFSEIFDMQEQFTAALNVESLSRGLEETDVNGVYFDLLKFLLTALSDLQAEEVAEEELQEGEQNAANINADIGVGQEAYTSQDLIRAATITAQMPQLNFGAPLNKLQLDPFTLTEILRLHILSSGARVRDDSIKFRYQQRGGYTSMDDPGLELRRSDPVLMRALSTQNIFDLTPGDKLSILKTLVQQLLTYVGSRDTLEENYEKLRTIKWDLRQLQAAEQRREREEAQYWYKKKMEERAKEKEAEEKRKAERNKLKEDKLKLDELKLQAKQEDKNLRDLAKAAGIVHLLDEKNEEEKENVEVEKRETRNRNKPPVEECPERQSTRQKSARDKEDADKEIPIENIDWEKVTPAERDAWRQRHKTKEEEFLEMIQELQHGHAIYPLGRDRTFRRYWVFRCLPGLYIEDMEEHVPDDMFKPVPQIGIPKIVNAETGQQAEGTENKSTASDKENDQKLLNGETTTITDDLKQNGNAEPMDVDSKSSVQLESVFEQTDKRTTCPWSYIYTQEQFGKLIESLNIRGIREGPLKTALIEQKEKILSSVQKCPTDMLSQTDNAANNKQGIKSQAIKSRNKVMRGAVNNASANEFIELNLRETLLDLEERVYAGALGIVKVKKREKWIEAIITGGYDQQVDLSWCEQSNDLLTSPLKIGDREKWRDDIENGSYKSQNEELTWSGKHIKTEMEKLEEEEEEDGEGATIEGGMNPVVRDLKKVLLQIEQGIDAKYLGPPLGEDDKTKQARQKASLEAAFRKGQQGKKDKKTNDSAANSDDDEDKENEAMKKTPLERWEESLMSSTSMPQIFLHASVLDLAITWTKSALHARCRICRRKGDAEHMLLCDSCDRGHHMYCLKPPVKKVPQGDWYCMDCRPKIIVQTPRKARRSRSTRDEEVEEEVEEEEEEETQDSEEEEDSDDEEVENKDEDDDEGEDDEGEDEEEDQDSDDEDDTDEEEVRKPITIKILRTRGGARSSAPSSGRSTPSSIGGRNEKRSSRSRMSLEPEEPPAKKARTSTGARVTKSRHSDPGPGKAAKSSGKKGVAAQAKTSRNSLEPARPARGSRRSLEKPERTTKRKLDLEDDEADGDKKVVSKSRGGEEANLMKMCEQLVHELSNHEDAWPFIRAVKRREAPDYFDIISTPMDFQTMRANLNKFEYQSPRQVLEDIRLVFTNCERYNVPDASEYLAGRRLCSHFVRRVKELNLHAVLTQEDSSSSSDEKQGKRSTKSSSPKTNGDPSPTSSRSRKSSRRN